jgi:hypothetical protein
VNFGAIGVIDDVAVGYDAIGGNEKAAASRKFLTTRVKGFYCYGGWFDTTHKFREQVLSMSLGNQTEQEGKRAED